MIIDTHAHLGWRSFNDDRDEIVARACAAGVKRIITIGTDLDSSLQALGFTDKYPDVYAALGVHPTDVTEVDSEEWVSRLEKMLLHPKAVAVGETGLDHFHPAPEGWTEESYRARQVEFFEAQLALAERLDLPVVVHQRESLEPILKVMKPWHGRVRCVFHCWNQSTQVALELIGLGHAVSFTGIVTFKNAPDVQECATALPAGSFFLETDSPFLAPVPRRGKRCEPAYTRATGEKIAELRGQSPESLFAETTAAAEAFFRLS